MATRTTDSFLLYTQDQTGSLLCCVAMKKRTGRREVVEDLDRVEAAFIKLDTDGDGFVDWEEFKHVTKHCDTEEARRVFEACDQVSGGGAHWVLM